MESAIRMRDEEIADWARRAVARRWPKARADEIEPLRGDASTRRFWRLRIDRGRSRAPKSAILTDLGPDDLPRYARDLNLVPKPLVEPPWINVHRFLSSIEVAVPELYEFDPARRAMLVEDAGDRTLSDAARASDAKMGDLFRLALETLLKIHIEGTRQIDSRCIAGGIAYDERLMRYELKEFVSLALPRIFPDADSAVIVPELDVLSRALGEYRRVFSHRDFHGQNLLLRNRDGAQRLCVIDFQDALMAPAAQDLAVLLTTRDTGTIVTPALEEKLLYFYYTGRMRQGAPEMEHDRFVESYRLCVLQHALKMIGRFILFEQNGNGSYLVYLPHAIAQAARILTGREAGRFPRLAEMLARTGAHPQ